MGLFDNIRNQVGSQFIEIIEWLDDSNNTLVYRFPVYNQEIKMGAQLTVRENQLAILVNEGKAADVFTPGRYVLQTENMPILTTLRGWKYGFQSPFKAEVYFFNTRLVTDLKWGTTNPVMMRDAEFGMIRMRAFGNYAMRVKDAKLFFQQIVGSKGLTTSDEIVGQLRSTILSRLSDAIAEAKIPALDLAAKYDELSAIATQRIAPEFESLGVELSRFFIENISLPEEVEQAIDQRTRLGVLGGQLNQYSQLQAADSMKIAAGNQGGMAGAGVGIGAGVAIGNMMGQALNQGSAQSAPPPPPPGGGAAATKWTVAIDGKTYGPYSEDVVRQMLQSSQLASSSMAWRPGAAAWAPLSSYAEFGSGSDMPPPLPPPLPK